MILSKAKAFLAGKDDIRIGKFAAVILDKDYPAGPFRIGPWVYKSIRIGRLALGWLYC